MLKFNLRVAPDKPVLIYATEDINYENVKELLEQGVDVNEATSNKETAIFYIFSHNYHKNYIKVMELLLENGANPNIQDLNGETVLLKTIISRYIAGGKYVAKLLLKYGADPYLENNNGLSAMREAKINNMTDYIKIMKEGYVK